MIDYWMDIVQRSTQCNHIGKNCVDKMTTYAVASSAREIGVQHILLHHPLGVEE